ncbi:MAG TPA: methyltransferase domain-containing protein [Chloroflexota bacterium]|nr:methyltransferase domain-containing protein [Chloroflexota bacterium]
MFKMTPTEAREFLTGFDHCSYQEAVDYLNVALDRLLVTLNMMPDLGEGAKVLELGSTPYFMTALMMEQFPYQLELANEHDRLKLDGGHVRLINRKLGIDRSFDYKTFNIETDRFPYDDGSLDAVIYCEMIEHLMHDPTHSLYEIHRVLKPGGYLLLSTPNPFRYTNYFRFMRAQNIYPPFSGWGPYARHNREFSAQELRLLLTQCNFELETLFTAYDPAYDHPTRFNSGRIIKWLFDHGMFKENMDVIHLRARAQGKAIYRYPPELYLDVHVYQRIVNDNIEMGVNDEAQLGPGYYKLENFPPYVRWTARTAEAKLLFGGQQTLGIRFYSGPKELGRNVDGTIKIGPESHSFDVAAGEWVELKFPTPAVEHGPLQVTIALDKPWVPCRTVQWSADSRDLGVAVQRIWLE